MDTLLNDLRFALRMMLKNRGVTLIALLTLAVAIGANTAIFSVVEAVLLRPLPYASADRLVSLWEMESKRGRGAVAPANLADYKKVTAFEGVAAYANVSMNLTEAGNPEQFIGQRVTADFFPLLGVRPLHGRLFLPEEDAPDEHRVVILTHELWQQRFGGDATVVGRKIQLDGRAHEVVGILPADFITPAQHRMTGRIRFFLPAEFPAELLANRGDHEVQCLARLKPGSGLPQAAAELDAISRSLAEQFPKTNANVSARIAPLADDLARDARTPLLILLGAVGVILLIGSVNVANLLLARGVGRQREFAVRFALGARPGRLVRGLLTESALLGAVGCAAGVLLGTWMLAALQAILPANTPRLQEAALNPQVLLFGCGVSFVAVLLFGMLPARAASAVHPGEALAASTRTSASARVLRWRGVLTATETALAIILLCGGGLLLKSLYHVMQENIGFETERVLALNIGLPETRYPTADKRLEFFQQLETRVARLPGVESVGYANRFPLRGGWGSGFMIDGVASEKYLGADFQAVSPGYFYTLGITQIAGRGIAGTDQKNSQPVAVVSREFSRRYLRDTEPIGRRFRRGPEMPWITIVGVVNDVRRDGNGEPLEPQVYLPAAQTNTYPVRLADLAVRVNSTVAEEPQQLAADIRREVLSLDPEQPVSRVALLSESLSSSLAPRRLQAILISAIAALATLLAMVGVFGVVVFATAQRTTEYGVRTALGAQAADLLRLSLWQGLLPVVVGTLVGLGVSTFAGKILQSALYEVAPTDPLAFAGAAAAQILAALAACWLPARRAARVDPMLALRYE